MSDIYLSRTNQKLSFVRLHLEALDASLVSNSWNRHGLVESYNESVLFHLTGAVHSFLREIAERYRLDASAVSSVGDLQRQLEQTGQEAPEASELAQLVESRESWLSRLYRAYDACWSARDGHLQRSDQSQSLSEIHVVQVNPDHSEDPAVLEEYRSWFAALDLLVERLRSSMLEW
ncbi:DUF6586 family protein [Marinobacterium lutimaris]|uniref:Uncharacterized protein n=1 Tax=Marinobacterium lutimaris TaxID=568106 RepID=A0A1H5UMT5_9GAMM|nr:DUF6586 family protein [Marinobacterium lutimaris]SEF76320.1 hypothetical protein SAMN05444390_101436 [Marinobacterium lutimaris]